MNPLHVQRTPVFLRPDPSRVLVRPFLPSDDARAARICARVMALPENKAELLLAEVLAEFGERHLQIRNYLKLRFEQVRHHLAPGEKLSEQRELLVGAYFTHEYSLESAALFNGSMVPHPDQSDLLPGSLRFALSLRATGEGHMSSITFRTGVVDARGGICINDPTRFCLEPTPVPKAHDKGVFACKLEELGLAGDVSRLVLEGLGGSFDLEDLRTSISLAIKHPGVQEQETETVVRKILTLAQSNYEVQFAPESRLSERVLFPSTPSQRNGIEDARFVRFAREDGTHTYYATYTAYDGRLTLPQFIETPDFLHFRFVTLNGAAVQNKGMALFPRKVNGLYAMLGRQDYENIFVMFSDDLHLWNTAQQVLKPIFPWEFIQVGNCGSPIECAAGWLVLSHGVGPMRKYCIGAFLLDRDDPTKVIGRLREPLLKPEANEREGYVPNVVYSCGSIVHNGLLVIPYAMSDYATTFATVPMDDLLAAMD